MKRTIHLVETACKDCGAPFLTTPTPVVPADIWARYGGRCAACMTTELRDAFNAELVRRWPEVRRLMAKQGLH